MILALTSFGFGVCAWVASLVGDHVGCGLLITLAMCSITHHSHGTDSSAYIGGAIISTVDKITSHVITLRCLHSALQFGWYALPVYIDIGYVAYVFYAYIHHNKIVYVKNVIYPWHVSIHLVSQFGVLHP